MIRMPLQPGPGIAAGVLAAALLIGGCAVTNPSAKVPPGSSVADATGALGKPTGEYALPGGGRRLEYATGPSGRETWMLDFDAGGRLVATTQVLNDRNFDTIRAGITSDELLVLLGRPAGRRTLSRTGEMVWSYRYESPACVLFQVSIDLATNRVMNTGRLPDPICTPDI
jgi:hypothetical protein